MRINTRIMELEEHIRETEKELKKLKEDAIKFASPKGYSSGTSWELHDCIRGSKKKLDIHKLAEDIDRLTTLIELDKRVLKMLKQNADVEEKLGKLKTLKEKIIYLRQLGYTVEETAEVLYVSPRHLYRLLKKYKEEGE